MSCCSNHVNGSHLALTVTNVIAIGAAALATITLIALSILVFATATPVAASLIGIGLGVKMLSSIAFVSTLVFLISKIVATVFSCKLIQSEDAANQALTAQHGVYNQAAASFTQAQAALVAAQQQLIQPQQQLTQAVAACSNLPTQVNQAVSAIGNTTKQYQEGLASAAKAHQEAKVAYEKATSQHIANVEELKQATRDYNLVTNTLKDTLTHLGVAVDQLPKKAADKVSHTTSSPNVSVMLPSSVSQPASSSTTSATASGDKPNDLSHSTPPRKASLSAKPPEIVVDSVAAAIPEAEGKKPHRKSSVSDITKKFEDEAKKEKEKKEKEKV